ncbi:ykwD, partial [Symbiodinium pilosum]
VAGSLGVMEERSYEHFGLLNELRAAGYTCPGGSSYAPNDVPLKFDCRLWKASQLHSQDMADNGYFSHTSQDGRSPWDRAEAQGIRANGENIAAGRSGAASVLDQWKNSDGHCKNMMNPNFKVFAVGYAYNSESRYRHYWTQMLKSSDVSDLDTSCYITAATTSSATTTTTVAVTTTTTTTTTTSTTTSTTSTTSTSVVDNTTIQSQLNATTSSAATSAVANTTGLDEQSRSTSSTSSSGRTTQGTLEESVTSTSSTFSTSLTSTAKVETSTTQLVTSTAGLAPTRRDFVKGQISMRMRSGESLASPPLDWLKTFLTQLGGGLLQAISFTARRLRRLEGTNTTVSFTAEVPAGRGAEVAARLESPEVFAATLTEVDLPETVEVLSVEVSEVLEAEALEGPAEVNSADGALIAVLVFAGLAVFSIIGILAFCYWRKQGTPKNVTSEGCGDPEAQVPPMNLPGFPGDADFRKSRSSNVVVSHL